MHPNIKTSLTKAQFSTPLYSPRATYSHHLRQITSLKTSMIINIDKYILGIAYIILGSMKEEFHKRGKEITLLQFIYFSKKYLKDWNHDLYGRDIKMQVCLLELWNEIDIEARGRITWEEFNSKIIQTSLNLKTLSNNAGIQAPSFKQLTVSVQPAKYESTIAKLIDINGKGKMAFFRDEAIQIEFFSTETGQQSPPIKPLVLPQQELKVETMIRVKEKNETIAGQKVVRKPQKMIKKDLKVSSYKNTVIDAIYLEDEKYDMLMVSSSDKFVRGYNVSGMLPVIDVQPENEDELMIHQFPVEVYVMAWDPVNQVLYTTGKHPKIYQWVIKTDSQRQMTDVKGHDNMISAMLMLPKLQLLATGGYDGKLVLWDTVEQVVKCKYEQHARAISSITFHEGLILLFTSSFDHKICIWNPYISSLIHKIDNSLNVISLQIIPNTNYLLSLDCGGTVRIREINRFTQVASFSVLRSDVGEDVEAFGKKDKTDRELSISMCSKKDSPVQYYFGTEKVVGFEYFEIQKSSIVGGSVTEMKYDPTRFRLLTPLKNHVVVWNLLTGRMDEVFYDMAEGDLASLEVAPDLGFFFCGDLDGNVLQRKLSNGFMVKSLAKLKDPVTTMKFYQLQRNQKQKSLKKTYLLFCATEEGEVIVFKSHPKTEFTSYKQFSIRGDFGITHGNLVGIEYFGLKNILAIRLNTNELLFADVQKRSLLTKVELGEMTIGGMNIVDHKDSQFFVMWNKSGQLTGLYLPPHPKKFKPSCSLQLEAMVKPENSLYGLKSNNYFFSTQQGELYCVSLPKKYLEVDAYTPNLSAEWKIKIQKRIVSMMLIENEQVLVVLNQGQQLMFFAVQNGDILCKLKQDLKNSQHLREPETILHFNEKKNQIYISNEDRVVKLDADELQQTQHQRILDPTFFTNFLLHKNIKNFNKISSSNWNLYLNFGLFVDQRIKEIKEIQFKLNNGVEKMFEKKGLTNIEKKIEKALELQKKWEKEKDLENNGDLSRNQHSMSKLEKTCTKFKKYPSRANSISVLWKGKQVSRRSQHSLNRQKKQLKQNNMKQWKQKMNDVERVDLEKLMNDPLYRLGQALKSMNTMDKKAQNFIEMARKKEQLKLPKINNMKLKF